MSWPIVKLGDIVDIKGGGTPSKSNPDFWGGDIPWASVKDFKSSSLRETTDFITELGVEKSATNVIPAGNVIVPTRMALGKVAINEVDIAINQDLKAILVRDTQTLSRLYVMRFIESKSAFIDEQGKGATVKGITLDVLKNLEVPLPPIAEQIRIAAILDKADAIRRKRQQAIQLADEFLRAVFLDMFGDIPAKKSKYQFSGCRGYVSASSGKSGRDVFSEIPTEIPIYGGNGINGYATRSLYDGPVIVLGRVGQQCAITNLTSGPAWVTDNAIVVQVTDSDRYNPVYLAYAFMHSPIRDTVTRLDLPFINQSMILDAPIPLPPVELQKKFERIREQTLQLIRSFRESAGETQSCFSAFSQKAFSGEL